MVVERFESIELPVEAELKGYSSLVWHAHGPGIFHPETLGNGGDLTHDSRSVLL